MGNSNMVFLGEIIPTETKIKCKKRRFAHSYANICTFSCNVDF